MLWLIIDASIGDIVGTLSAIDLDDTTLRYGYESGATSLFSINETVSIICHNMMSINDYYW